MKIEIKTRIKRIEKNGGEVTYEPEVLYFYPLLDKIFLFGAIMSFLMVCVCISYQWAGFGVLMILLTMFLFVCWYGHRYENWINLRRKSNYSTEYEPSERFGKKSRFHNENDAKKIIDQFIYVHEFDVKLKESEKIKSITYTKYP